MKSFIFRILTLIVFNANVIFAATDDKPKMSSHDQLLNRLVHISILEKKGVLTEAEVNQQLQFLLRNGYGSSEYLHNVLIKQELVYLRNVEFLNVQNQNPGKVFLEINHIDGINSSQLHIQLSVFILKIVRNKILGLPISTSDMNEWNRLVNQFDDEFDKLNEGQKRYVAESVELLVRHMSLNAKTDFDSGLQRLLDRSFDIKLVEQVVRFEDLLQNELAKVNSSGAYQSSQIGFLMEASESKKKERLILSIQKRYQGFMSTGLNKVNGEAYQKQRIGFTCEAVLQK